MQAKLLLLAGQRSGLPGLLMAPAIYTEARAREPFRIVLLVASSNLLGTLLRSAHPVLGQVQVQQLSAAARAH